MLVKKILLLCSLALFSTSVFATKADDIVGYWATEDDKGTVQIYKKKGHYYGKLVWVDVVHRGEKTKDQVVDDKNPDPKKHTRSVVGINLLKKFTFDKGDERWEKGKIYDPENGKTYSCKMWFEKNKKKLNIRGYIGISLFGRTTVWRRIPGEVPPSYQEGGKNYIRYKLGQK
jgi:uncharacterized protein (DUF2147 family)